MTNLDSILKSRDITLPKKICLVKAMIFPIVMYECESWTTKKAECRKTDAFELWCWRRLLRVSWTKRRSIQSILKEISPGYSSEGLMLKLQYFGHLMQRADSFEKTLMLGKIEGRKRRRWQRMRWWMASQTQCTFVWVNSRCWKWTRRPDMLWFMGSQRVGHDWATGLSWAELIGHLHVLLRKTSVQIVCLVFNYIVYSVIYLFWCWAVKAVYIVWILTPYGSYYLQTFSPIQ